MIYIIRNKMIKRAYNKIKEIIKIQIIKKMIMIIKKDLYI